MGLEIASGNCEGADQAYASGANLEHPELVHLYLTGPRHNANAIVPGNHIYYADDHPEWIEVARRNHPRYNFLSPYVKKLMNRNAGIVLSSQLVIALPNPNKSWGGGTGHGMKIAKEAGIPVWDITKDKQLVADLKAFLKLYLKGEKMNGRIQT
jgi:hypothetical protein